MASSFFAAAVSSRAARATLFCTSVAAGIVSNGSTSGQDFNYDNKLADFSEGGSGSEESRSSSSGGTNNSFPPTTHCLTEATPKPPRMFKESKKHAFNTEFRDYRLADVLNLAEDVAVFRFLMRDPEHVFDLPACSTLQMTYKVDPGVEPTCRYYTPVTTMGTKGYFDIIVKKQPRGKMSEYLWGMSIGDYAQFRCVMFKMQYRPNQYEHIGMIAGGSGITPILQVLRYSILNCPKDKTKFNLVYANQTETKILLKQVLDDLEMKSDGRLKVDYIINRFDPQSTERKTWKGWTGKVDANLIMHTMPPPSGNTKIKVMLCGPDKMISNLCGIREAYLKSMWRVNTRGNGSTAGFANFPKMGGVFADLGYLGEQVYRF